MSPGSCDLDQNPLFDRANKIVTHWGSFLTLYYFHNIFFYWPESSKYQVLIKSESDRQGYVTLFIQVWHTEITLIIFFPSYYYCIAYTLSMLDQSLFLRQIAIASSVSYFKHSQLCRKHHSMPLKSARYHLLMLSSTAIWHIIYLISYKKLILLWMKPKLFLRPSLDLSSHKLYEKSWRE